MALTSGTSRYIGGSTFSGASTPSFFGIPQDALPGIAGLVGGILLLRKLNARRDAEMMRRLGTSAQAPQEQPPVPALWDAEHEPIPALDEEGEDPYGTPPLDRDGNLGVTHDPMRRRVAGRFLGQGRYV